LSKRLTFYMSDRWKASEYAKVLPYLRMIGFPSFLDIFGPSKELIEDCTMMCFERERYLFTICRDLEPGPRKVECIDEIRGRVRECVDYCTRGILRPV
jgi:hypothetical protein